MRRLIWLVALLLLAVGAEAQDFIRYYPSPNSVVGATTITVPGDTNKTAAWTLRLSPVDAPAFARDSVTMYRIGGVRIWDWLAIMPHNLEWGDAGNAMVMIHSDLGTTGTGLKVMDSIDHHDLASFYEYKDQIGDTLHGNLKFNWSHGGLYSIFNTYTSATDYESGVLGWTSNEFRIGTAKGGGGGSSRATKLFSLANVYLSPGGGYNIYTTLASDASFLAETSDQAILGNTASLWKSAFITRSIQGSKSKTLTDNTATAFVRLAVADDDYEGCEVIYTAYAEDTATDARQTRTGKVAVAILNNGGTETAAFSTGDSAVVVTAGTFTCTFDGNSGAADTIDLRATCDTSLAATTTLTFEYRLDCPSTVTVTPQ